MPAGPLFVIAWLPPKKMAISGDGPPVRQAKKLLIYSRAANVDVANKSDAKKAIKADGCNVWLNHVTCGM